MKTKFTTTALILASGLIASTSFAAEPLTRADVKAEYLAAKVAGTLPAVGIRDNLSTYPAQTGDIPSSLTRATVKSNFRMAEAAGNLPAIGERARVDDIRVGKKSLTRQDVMAEYATAKAAGNLPHISESKNLFLRNVANTKPASNLTAGWSATKKMGG
jgi:hypothetical protein